MVVRLSSLRTGRLYTHTHISAVIKTHKFRFMRPPNTVHNRDVTPILLCISNSGSKLTLKNSPFLVIVVCKCQELNTLEYENLYRLARCMVFLENLWLLVRPIGSNSPHVRVSTSATPLEVILVDDLSCFC